MDVLAIQKAYRKIIARYVVNERSLVSAIQSGDRLIHLESARRFVSGEKVVIINPTTEKGEIVVIDSIPDRWTLKTVEPIIASYDDSCIVRKILGYESGIEQYIRGIYLGDPAVISHFPAITINAKSRSSEWMTLESTKETYNIDISVFVQAADYESQYEMMMVYTHAIESALFRSLYPLAEPYYEFPLEEGVSESDTLFKISGTEFVCGASLFFENIDHLVYNRIVQPMGNGVYRTAMPIGQDFEAGDSVIFPRRHIFNSLPATTQYGTVNKGTMLKAAVISLTCEEETRRFAPYIDPLTH
jgi:hypothetical protein